MRQFIINSFRFSLIGLIPLLLLLSLYMYFDPFKVIYTYDSFYNSNEKGYVGMNKGHISTSTFINNGKKNKDKYDSFIFGNSRSIYYQIADWKTHLAPNSHCFHFDASTESLWALNKKIEFLDNQGVQIKNALVILDYSILVQDQPQKGHLFETSPILVGNQNLIDFHSTFFKAFITPKFLFAYFDFKISGQVKPYMKNNFLLDDRPMNYEPSTNEESYDYYESLIKINQYYTPERMSVFNLRDSVQSYSPLAIKANQKTIFDTIQSIFKKQHTKVKIVISPLYDQIKLNEKDVRYLKMLFGKQNVFDFSGINPITKDYKNYYENSHYRPHVTRKIMDEIYKN